MAVSKKKRTRKVSQGIHGATHHPLSEIEKALADKGIIDAELAYRASRPPITPWRGVGEDQIAKRGPWSAANVEENKRLYPHLFPELAKKRR